MSHTSRVRTLPWTLSLAVLGALTLTLSSPDAFAQSGSQDEISVRFIDPDGNPIGAGTLEQTPNGVLIAAELSDLPPGEHAFHIHETGRCDPATGFGSAGGHYAPRGQDHGFKVEAGPHAGDMPNQFASENGELRVHVFNPNVSLSGGEAPLLDSDGSALVIHAEGDDYESQPSGDAGDRIACAEIAR